MELIRKKNHSYHCHSLIKQSTCLSSCTYMRIHAVTHMVHPTSPLLLCCSLYSLLAWTG